MCGGKKKKRKRMIRQMLNWNTDVVLAYNGKRLNDSFYLRIKKTKQNGQN